MVLFDRPLLPGLVRVAVVNAGTYHTIIVHFNEVRILKLRTVVRQYYRKQLAKHSAAKLYL